MREKSAGESKGPLANTGQNLILSVPRVVSVARVITAHSNQPGRRIFILLPGSSKTGSILKKPFPGISFSGPGRGAVTVHSQRRGIPVFQVLILCLCLVAVRTVSAYGALGHQVIASLAEAMLTPKARAEVKSILGPAGGSATLASISTWADDIRMLRPETRPWHYVTIQISEARYDSAKADSANIVKALKRQLAILAQPGADRYAREEALKWVVHLVGDLHQPLHAGEDHDKGGNLAKVRVNRRTHNLHAVWDNVLLERLNLPLDSLGPMLARRLASDPAFVRRNAQGTVEAWTDETHSKAAACYQLRGKRMRKGIAVQLDREYVNAATVTVLDQLRIGGVRLAHALNRALDPAGTTVAPTVTAAGLPGLAASERDDSAAFFAQADALRVVETADSVSEPAHTGVKPKTKPEGKRKPAGSAHGKSAGKFAWSINSDVYHHSECADVARIKRKNLRSGDSPPPGMRLHVSCPVPK